LDSVNVLIHLPTDAADQFSIGSSNGLTNAVGAYSITVAINTAVDESNLPDTLGLYVVAVGFPPEYAVPPGEQRVIDSVLANVAFGAGASTLVNLSVPFDRAGAEDRQYGKVPR
jgi:hypothetical protein